MGVRVTGDDDAFPVVAIYDSVSGWAFGPVFEGQDAAAAARHFLAWTETEGYRDPRAMSEPELIACYSAWLRAHGGQFGYEVAQ